MQMNSSNSLMKIGDVTNKFGISHRSLHYWESAGILKSSRAENDYRYYDEENLLKIKQIVLLRKLRLSIPSIQEIFTSEKLSRIISVFTDHLTKQKKKPNN
jgi:DNA-binding transcriptional MerR regulator